MLEILLGLVVIYAVIITAMFLREHVNAQSEKLIQEKVMEKRQAMMDATIEAKADEAMRLHQTFQKFVPRQFVDHFAKNGEKSLELGRADEDRVAVLFCDIRGFTALSEKLSPQDLMYFLNSYFLRMNAPIHQNKGFIDKFIGDAIMALFDSPDGGDADKASDAVRAALEIQVALKLYNSHRANSKYAPVKNGIGLHFGPVVLGTVGSDDRMDTTVLGDTVNVAQRIEGLCRYFNTDIMASASTISLANEIYPVEYRLVDNILFKGKSISIPVVEVLSHMDDEKISRKKLIGEHIMEGIRLREDGYLKTAHAHFINLRESFPEDEVLRHHVLTCEKALEKKNWDGLVRL
uniref:adenylate/guanylate cyclase domain-containing protein n=1 Tax=Ningiella ruwaisensis TaxID=2364274 RepID=UPI001F4FDF69|nr:adenylate/guanylate cyclase domain-containing protein [Ningiella ruwaisensis]